MTIFHAHTAQLIERLRKKGPQSLLLTGPAGVGHLEVALAIAGSEQISTISPDEAKASRPITVDVIRQLHQTTRSASNDRQYIIIHEAETMTHAAQGAFLKLLEEPNSSVYFILTSALPDILLPTIRSRVQQYTLPPITLQQSEAYLDSKGIVDATMRRQLLYIAAGLPQKLNQLITDSALFEESATIVKDARELLQAAPYATLLVVNRYRDSRTKATHLIEAATTMTRQSLSQRPQKALVTQLDKLLKAQEQLATNGNVRLTLAQLVL